MSPANEPSWSEHSERTPVPERFATVGAMAKGAQASEPSWSELSERTLERRR